MMLKNSRYFRLLNGYTQTQLAEAVGTTQQAIARWEVGRYEPGIEAICNLAAALNITTDDLMGFSLQLNNM